MYQEWREHPSQTCKGKETEGEGQTTCNGIGTVEVLLLKLEEGVELVNNRAFRLPVTLGEIWFLRRSTTG